MSKRIVIVGGGFAGLTLAQKASKHKDFEVVVVDTNNYHFFPPLLYQVSTAFIEPSNISYPFRKLFQGHNNVRFHMGTLIKVLPEQDRIETTTGILAYDYLVLAMGTETNFFGNENIAKNSLPMKTLGDALNIRNHILLRMEDATRTASAPHREKLSTIVIAGGGPTGVEMAGMIAEMARNIASKDYPEAVRNSGKIYLIDGTATLLGAMSEKAKAEAYRVLEKLGVKIILNTLVKDYVDEEVILSNDQHISAATLLWVSGVIARDVPGLSRGGFTRGRRIRVDEFNLVAGYPNIFAVGDQCLQEFDTNYPQGHPQLAQVAIQQSTLLADNIFRLENNIPLKPFAYKNKGSMAIISKYRAVVDLPKSSFKGTPAWLTWLFVHIIPLVGFRNKLKIALNWFWSFCTNDPTLRLVIRPDIEKNNIDP